MKLPEVSTIIRINSVQLEECIDQAFDHELAHVLSEESDHEGGCIETPTDLPQERPSSTQQPFVNRQPSSGNTQKTFQRPSCRVQQPSVKGKGKGFRAKVRRQKKRAIRWSNCPNLPRFSYSKKFKDIHAITVDFNAEDLPAANGAFVSKRQKCGPSQEWTLEELVNRGFKVINWNGRSVVPSYL